MVRYWSIILVISMSIRGMERVSEVAREGFPTLYSLLLNKIVTEIYCKDFFKELIQGKEYMTTTGKQGYVYLPSSSYQEILYLILFKNSKLALDDKKNILSFLQQEQQASEDTKEIAHFFITVLSHSSFNYMQFLQEKVNSKLSFGPIVKRSLLNYAINPTEPEKPSEATVRFLVTHGAHCDEASESITPFALACKQLSIDTIQVMIGHDANLKNRLCNPLYYASIKGRREVVETLLAAGACGNDMMQCPKDCTIKPVIDCLKIAKNDKNAAAIERVMPLLEAQKMGSSTSAGGILNAKRQRL